jgi:hypothetical protein
MNFRHPNQGGMRSEKTLVFAEKNAKAGYFSGSADSVEGSNFKLHVLIDISL